jgi:hypothetical protein
VIRIRLERTTPHQSEKQTPEQTTPVFLYLRPPVQRGGPVSVVGQLGVSSLMCAGNPSVIFRIMLEETQKAPSTIALTKINAAQIANALSFIATSTRRTSVTVAHR